jgi:protein subunit release factor B
MKKNIKKLLFSLTKNDFRWDYFRCPGKGGQKVNKTSSGVRCTHPPSSAVGQACDVRSQHLNKRLAFERMAKTKEFKQWHTIEVARKTGLLDQIAREVDRQMKDIKVDIKEDGIWVEVDKNKILSNEDQER